MKRGALLSVVTVLALVSCGDDSDDDSTPSPDPINSEPRAGEVSPGVAPAPAKQPKPGSFTGVDATNYEVGEEVCGAFPQEKTARDLGLPASADEFTIAQEYAKGTVERFRQASFEGCLAGLGIP